jgi:hypothetical protein
MHYNIQYFGLPKGLYNLATFTRLARVNGYDYMGLRFMYFG